MNTPKKDPASVEDVDAGDHHKGTWLDLGPKHQQNVTKRRGLISLPPLFTATQNKLSLNRPEKIALISIALIFIVLTFWAGYWLKQKNQQAESQHLIKSPAKGKYASISDFSSYWKIVDNTPGIKRGAIAIPVVSIELRKRQSSGALRFYFRDSSKQKVGDPVTLSFANGIFPNGLRRVDISASDGFHSMVDFETYQLGDLGAWSIEILESQGEMEPSANFSLLFQAVISPGLR